MSLYHMLAQPLVASEKPTPVETYGDYFAKRDDLYEYAGVRGGKVRACKILSEKATGLITAGARSSPQVNIVAHIGKFQGIPTRGHIPAGELLPELVEAQSYGMEIVQHKAGYNSVIIKRALDDAKANPSWTYIPFGMAGAMPEPGNTILNATAAETFNLPFEHIKRIVVPVGSGVSLSGILSGLRFHDKNIPVVGVVVGAEPKKRLNHYADNRGSQVTLVEWPGAYHTPAETTEWNGIELDPFYEAKCLPFLQPGDLFWIVGIRNCKGKI